MNTRTIRPTESMRPITREEYLRVMAPVAPFAEYQCGFMVTKTAAQGRHGRAIRGVIEALCHDSTRNARLEVYQGVCVDFGENIFVPDVVLLRLEDHARYDSTSGNIVGPPELIVEVVSHDSGARDRVMKFNCYFEAGVPWYWLIDPFEFTVEEWQSTDLGYVRTAAATIGHMFRPRAVALEVPADDLFPTVG
ncbi:MAG: Uma2 family endonuclease [Proteobacteria bacterium]|nr:Uma2 family endonuclease [Pseudomonadota bacterium]